MATRWEVFKSQWADGCESSLCPGSSKCLARGKIPCEILFIGEAPSISAEVLKSPFVGPTGILLDTIIEQAVPDGVRCAFTNIVACMPRDPERSARAIQPSDEAILACRPRLLEFIDLCNPKLIVAVGSVARDSLPELSIPVVHIVHPSHIMRQNAYKFRGAVEKLTKAVSDHVTREHEGGS